MSRERILHVKGENSPCQVVRTKVQQIKAHSRKLSSHALFNAKYVDQMDAIMHDNHGMLIKEHVIMGKIGPM